MITGTPQILITVVTTIPDFYRAESTKKGGAKGRGGVHRPTCHLVNRHAARAVRVVGTRVVRRDLGSHADLRIGPDMGHGTSRNTRDTSDTAGQKHPVLHVVSTADQVALKRRSLFTALQIVHGTYIPS